MLDFISQVDPEGMKSPNSWEEIFIKRKNIDDQKKSKQKEKEKNESQEVQKFQEEEPLNENIQENAQHEEIEDPKDSFNCPICSEIVRRIDTKSHIDFCCGDSPSLRALLNSFLSI